MSRQTFVIVGASLAGAKAAEELRANGFDGRVVLIGSEPERPYERPPLTKDYLRGDAEREQAYVHEAGFYAEHEIELMLGTTVTAIDARASRLTLAEGGELAYDRLLLTTGAEPRRSSLPGSELDGIHYLRTLADCDVLRERLAGGGRVAVVGAGWIGSEFAASARQRGLEVTVIDGHALPNERIFGAEVGTFYRDTHEAHGVRMQLGAGVEAFEGSGAVERVRTTSGVAIECDLAVVGIGAVPRSGLAADAGLLVDDGILVDDRLCSTVPNVFAAGDVARASHPFYGARIRVEHWANALNQGPAAARAMLGGEAPYDELPYFFSDQYDIGMEYSGYAPAWDEVVLRGEPASAGFMAFWIRDGRVAAGMNVNVWDVNPQVQALIRSRLPVDLRALADPGTSLESLVPLTTDAQRSA
jgi:3-phenylpropionate/trans-cinnamate dioxygenase ferredoxin reductase component